LILGLILIAFVLLVPKGLVPTLGDWGLRCCVCAASARQSASNNGGGVGTMAEPLLQTRDLSMHFGGVRAYATSTSRWMKASYAA